MRRPRAFAAAATIAALLACAVLGAAVSGPEAARSLEPGGAAARSATAASSDARGGAPADAQLALGRDVYNFRCYFCHGYSGDARTVAASYLSPPPRDFTSLEPGRLTSSAVVRVLREGRPGTAMASFAGIIGEREMLAVAEFVVDEFVRARRPNTHYHTAENGWPDHERHRAAFPFARGEIALDRAPERLDARQAAGRRLFVTACITCHEGRVEDDALRWDARAVSFPPDGHDCVSCHDRVRRGESPPPGSKPISYHGRSVSPAEAMQGGGARPAPGGQDRSGVTHGDDIYARHDVPVPLSTEAGAQARRGEDLYLRNCAFCHAADGTGRNWIGRFLEPHPRDLSDPAAMAHLTPATLAERIRDGVAGTSMPAWGHVLNAEEIAAIVAYVEAAFRPWAAQPGVAKRIAATAGAPTRFALPRGGRRRGSTHGAVVNDH